MPRVAAARRPSEAAEPTTPDTPAIESPSADTPEQPAIVEVATERRRLLRLAADICRRRFPDRDSRAMVHIRQIFSSDELLIFDALGWDNTGIAKELGRQQKIYRFQGEAGTSSDRVAASELRDRAAESLATRGGEIREQIAKLTAELRQLEAADQAAAELCERQQNALRQLRECVDPETRRAADEALRSAVAPIDRDLAAARARFQNIENWRKVEPGSIAAIPLLEKLGREYGRQFIRRDMSGCPSANFEAWRRFIDEVAAELPGLKAKVYELVARRRAAVAKADAMLDAYAR